MNIYEYMINNSILNNMYVSINKNIYILIYIHIKVRIYLVFLNDPNAYQQILNDAVNIYINNICLLKKIVYTATLLSAV